MNKYTLIISIFITSLLLSSLVSNQAFAGTPVLDERQKNQNKRIKQGVKSGELTVKETKKLRKGQKRLKNKERKAKADGVVTKKERARLQHNANKQSAKIAKKKNNKKKRQ